MTVSWKAFWTTLGVVLAGTWAGLAALVDIPAWATILVFAAAAALFSVIANRVVHGSRMFHQVSSRSKQHIVRLLTGAAAAHALWVAVFALRPSLWPLWLVILGGLGVVEYLLALGHQYLLTQLKPVAPSPAAAQRQRAALAARANERAADGTIRMFREALDEARLGWVRVKSWAPVGIEKAGDQPYGAEFVLQVPSARAIAETGDKSAANNTVLGPQHAEPLAIALSNVLTKINNADIELNSDWVTIEKRPQAGIYAATVVNEDVMDRTFEFKEDLTWTTMATPMVFGREMSGRIFQQPINGHSRAIGGSTWGKSSLFHDEVAHVTKADAVAWVGGVEKLYDLVAGWIEVYRGKGIRPPFDWIANGQLDTLRMVVAALNVARWRQRQPMHMRGGWPYLIVFLDEVSFFAANRQVTVKYQGMDINAGQALATGMKGAASANVLFKMASQRSTNDNFGDQGGDVNSNWMYSAVFHSADEAEIGRVLGNNYFKLLNPSHRGECWLNSEATGGVPRRMKVPYIQSVDPTKPRLHDGITLADVAWSRRNFERELDAGSQRAAGEHYEQRHQLVDDELMGYLTGSYADLRELEQGDDGDDGRPELELSGATQRGFETAQSVVAAALAARGMLPPQAASAVSTATDSVATEGDGSAVAVEAPPMKPEPAAAHAVLDLDEHRSLADRAAAVVRQAGRPVTKQEIADALTQLGVDLGEGQVLTNALTACVKKGALTRPTQGVYVAS